jgi:hypothetical protein
MVDVVGDLAPRPEVMQPRVVLQSIFYSLVQVGDGKYLGQDIFIWIDSVFKSYQGGAKLKNTAGQRACRGDIRDQEK